MLPYYRSAALIVRYYWFAVKADTFSEIFPYCPIIHQLSLFTEVGCPLLQHSPTLHPALDYICCLFYQVFRKL